MPESTFFISKITVNQKISGAIPLRDKLVLNSQLLPSANNPTALSFFMMMRCSIENKNFFGLLITKRERKILNILVTRENPQRKP